MASLARSARALLPKLELLWDSVRTQGGPATVRRLLEHALRDRVDSDRSFDSRHGTDTRGLIVPGALGIEDSFTRAQAAVYLPTPERVTRHVISRLVIDPSQWSFVDYGAGKGRILLVASAMGFRRVIGIEISEALCAVARANLAAYRNGRARPREIEIIWGDARVAELPREDCVLFLYRPFSELVLRSVLHNLERSLREHPRRVRLIYVGVSKDPLRVLDDCKVLRRYAHVPCLEPKYSWAIYGQ